MSAPESSSDSEEDVLRRLRQQMSLQQGHSQDGESTHMMMIGNRTTGGSPVLRSFSLEHHTPHYSSQQHHHRGGLVSQRSFDLSHHPLHQSTPSSNPIVPSSSSQHHHHPQSSSQSSSATFTSVRPLRVSSIRDIDDVSCISSSSGSRRRPKGNIWWQLIIH